MRHVEGMSCTVAVQDDSHMQSRQDGQTDDWCRPSKPVKDVHHEAIEEEVAS
jgi:hypothetical protein